MNDLDKTSEILNSFVAVLRVLLPQEILQKYSFENGSGQFLVEIIFPSDESIFQPITTRRDFARTRYQGALVPSAREPGTSNLVIFGDLK